MDLSRPFQFRRFKISNHEINGPLNLKETILSAQTSAPEWTREGELFTNIEELDGTLVKYSLNQQGPPDRFIVNVQFIARGSSKEIKRLLRAHLNKVLGLRDDLHSFYEEYSSQAEPLSSTFGILRGLRLMRGTNLYESLICSILSQNNSAKRWNQIAQLLMKNYGRHVRLPDGSCSSLFPKPSRIARLRIGELQSRTSIGYRAKSVIAVSRMVADEQLELERLRKCSYEEALEILLQLHGVGPKVADCFLLYGLGKLEAAPVDVWIHRIVTRLYFRGRRKSRRGVARFLRKRFGIWAGYAQLYLFDYARRTSID
jgi:N-glycosylase/DNA lyase